MLNNTFRTKQLVILSGKGGTGKTSLSAAFAHLAYTDEPRFPAVLVDADVDAANLSLALLPIRIEEPMGSRLQPDSAHTTQPAKVSIPESHDFIGTSLAEIDKNQCSGCGNCISVCRYDAILQNPRDNICQIDPIACDGCAACVYACPQNAIRMLPQQEGQWFRSATQYGHLFHAELLPGRDNSGKLVTLVKQQARLEAEDEHIPLIIIDGPPGIGCPVISACAGADLGLIVTEPSLAGIHDLERVLGTLQHFRVPAVICINKANIYPHGANQIRSFAAAQGIEVLGDIPYDTHIPQAMIQGRPLTAVFPESPSAQAIRNIWEMTTQHLLVQEDL